MKNESTTDPLGRSSQRIFVAGLDGVKYSEKMSDAELGSLWGYLQSEGFATVNSVFTRAGLDACNSVLCRWPRPSEIGRMAVTNGEKLAYHLMKVPVEGDMADMVGRQGANLIELTEDYDLLYAWVKGNTKGAALWIYARTPKQLFAADGSDLVNAFRKTVIDANTGEKKDKKGAMMTIRTERKILHAKTDDFVGM